MSADRFPKLVRRQSLLQNMSWSVIGQTASAVGQWGILVILIKVLDAESVGQYALALAIAGPLFAFSNLQLSGLIASDQAREFTPLTYVTLRICTSMGALLLLFMLSVFANFHSAFLCILISVALIKTCEAVSDLLYGFCQQQERMDRVGMLQSLRAAISAAIAWSVAGLTQNIMPVLMALLLGQVLMAVSVDARQLRFIVAQSTATISRPSKIPLSQCGDLFRSAFPMGLVIGLNTLAINMPRYWLASSVGESAVGVFAALSYVMTGGNMAIGAIAQAAVPKLARLHQHHHLKFLHLIGLVAIPAIVAGLIGISIAAMAGRVFLTHLYNSTYQEYTETFLWMMIAAAILYLVSVTGCALTSVRLFLHQASITTFSTVTTILACLILVPTHGLTGAAMSLCVGFLTKLGGQMAILILCLRRNTSQGIANQ